MYLSVSVSRHILDKHLTLPAQLFFSSEIWNSNTIPFSSKENGVCISPHNGKGTDRLTQGGNIHTQDPNNHEEHPSAGKN